MAAHIPFQALTSGHPNAADSDPMDKSYKRPANLATQLTAFAFLLVGLVLGFTATSEGESAVALFLDSTLEHQEGVGGDEYGAGPLSFSGTHPKLRGIFHQQLFGSSSLFKPTFLAFASLSLAAGFLAKGRSVTQLGGLSAMITAAVQLWKSHAAGRYIEWYYPFLLVVLIGATTSAHA